MQILGRVYDKQWFDRVLSRVKLLQEMERAGVPKSFLQDCPEEDLLRLSQKINQMEVREEVASLNEEAVKYLVHDQGFLTFLVRLLREESVEPKRVSSLLAGAEECLSEGYSCEEIIAVMEDRRVDGNRTYTYLKYFVSASLNEKEKGCLMDSLTALDSCEDVRVGDLTEPQRRFMTEPLIACRFLQEMIAEREFWKRLENPEFHALLSELFVYANSCTVLKPKQTEDLWQHIEEIHTGLKEVFRHLLPQEIGDFLHFWLNNEAPVYDLRRLKRLLSDIQPEREVSFTQNRVAYLNFLYGDLLEGVDFDGLSEAQKDLLVYGITHRKKHFLKMVKEHFDDFVYLRPHLLLLDADTYERYLNVNTLNPKNLKECSRIWRMDEERKSYLTKEEYTFDELKLLSTVECEYIPLYHHLTYPKVDDRLRVMRELLGRGHFPYEIREQERLAKLGEMLSIKPLSKWRTEELGHVEYLSYQQTILLLSVWEDVKHFIPEIRTGYHAEFLLQNLESLKELPDFKTAAKKMLEIDRNWKYLNDKLKIGDEFLSQNQEGLKRFLYDGGAEIFNAFLSDDTEMECEKVKRLCVAEIAGRFSEVKYYRNDLNREIALQIPEEIQELWKKNTRSKKGEMKIWEEDRLLPIMQIGEILGSTCLSFRNGKYKECLLSCFDANKKVVFVSAGGMLVFRAIIRLTKGAFYKVDDEEGKLQFADIMQEETEEEADGSKREYLTLFLERPYFKNISGKREKEVVWLAIQMLQKKAREMHAELVLSDSYKNYVLQEKKFIRTKYYMYISTSKNGQQYLDSLGGKAGVKEEGSYEKGYFLLEESFVNLKVASDGQGGTL